MPVLVLITWTVEAANLEIPKHHNFTSPLLEISIFAGFSHGGLCLEAVSGADALLLLQFIMNLNNLRRSGAFG